MNEVSSENLWRARRGGVGRRCKYRRGSDTFTVRLAFIRTLGQTFGGPMGKPLEKPLGGPGFRGGQSEGNLSLPLKVPLYGSM